MSQKCSQFVTGYEEEGALCRCPSCKGFLPKDFPLGKQFLCNKCGAVLETLPSEVEDPEDKEDTEYEYGGRLCLVPQYAINIDTTLPVKPKKKFKEKTNLWAVGKAFFRRIWLDENGSQYIEIAPDKIYLPDDRVLKIIENAGDKK